MISCRLCLDANSSGDLFGRGRFGRILSNKLDIEFVHFILGNLVRYVKAIFVCLKFQFEDCLNKSL